MSRRVVVLGAGHGGGEVVAALRAGGFDGPLTLVGDEATPPYQRPPLSKSFLLGASPADELLARPRSFYEQQQVDLVLGRRVDHVDTTARTVQVGDESVPYDVLVLALGGRPRMLADPAAAKADNLHQVKTHADVERLRDRLAPGTRVGVVGGGFVGLEVAASARKRGAEVTVLELAPRLLGRVCSEVVAEHVASLHGARGVDVRTGVTGLHLVTGDDGRIARVATDQGIVEVDEVVVGIGMTPETGPAEQAGLAVDDGILVDADYRTSAPDVFAIGDCARVLRPDGSTLRLESAPHAASSARRVAAVILGRETPPDAAPWFWSHQFEVKIQMAGDPSARVSRWVTRGDMAGGSFLTFGIVEDRIVRIEAVDRPAEFAQTKSWLDRPIPSVIDRLADESYSIRQLFARP
ncbi:NAD(P)/FAD-dependent oxidoreductase [Aeromicrobium fastidiosum]|uniref:NAD(P)/FAD-dependent oxidoreductase n=1 Tax=Aeromicrobium fastidiosum TaxID=52699 RepID=UPI00165FA9A8|nr:FAD-dependent oxidoreductase [Aeromicrobium fastidiosum]MBP2392504.1 3-phenylpropionate/trans-cinnamate dioxygenase ferredoxin reductase subunit [Aeromicrobium fastidiosum]